MGTYKDKAWFSFLDASISACGKIKTGSHVKVDWRRTWGAKNLIKKKKKRKIKLYLLELAPRRLLE